MRRSWTATSGCLAPRSLKRVLDQLSRETAGRVAGQADNREADVPAPAGQRSVFGRRGPEGFALARANSLERRAEGVAGPGFHLDHNQVVPSPADEIDLPAPRSETRADDLVASPRQ